MAWPFNSYHCIVWHVEISCILIIYQFYSSDCLSVKINQSSDVYFLISLVIFSHIRLSIHSQNSAKNIRLFLSFKWCSNYHNTLKFVSQSSCSTYLLRCWLLCLTLLSYFYKFPDLSLMGFWPTCLICSHVAVTSLHSLHLIDSRFCQNSICWAHYLINYQVSMYSPALCRFLFSSILFSNSLMSWSPQYFSSISTHEFQWALPRVSPLPCSLETLLRL